MTVDSLKWAWTVTFAAHHTSRLMSHVDSCVNSSLDSAWQVLWAFLALDHDVDERLTSGCCHVRCICQLKCTVESLCFIILSLHSQFLAFFVSCTRHGSCVHRVVIAGTVSSVAPSVSAHPAEPQDLFQMSGSNINSWTVTNCASLGTVARARELVNGSERRHRDGIAVRLQCDQCCFALQNKWRDTGCSLENMLQSNTWLLLHLSSVLQWITCWRRSLCNVPPAHQGGGGNFTLTQWWLLLAGCVVGLMLSSVVVVPQQLLVDCTLQVSCNGLTV